LKGKLRKFNIKNIETILFLLKEKDNAICTTNLKKKKKVFQKKKKR